MLNYFIVLFAACLVALANGGHTGDSHYIQRMAFDGQSSQQVNTNETDGWRAKKFDIKRYSYQWTIANFSLCSQKYGEFLSSPIFPETSTDDDELMWTIRLYPRSYDEYYRDKLSIYIWDSRPTSNERKILMMFKFSILDQDGNCSNLMVSRHPKEFVLDKGWGIDKFIARDHLFDTNAGLLSGDKLTILCEFEALIERSEIDWSQVNLHLTAPIDELPSHFEQLYESQQFCDLTISIGKKEFKAHRAILATRSAVFRQMLDDGSDEPQVDRLELADVHPDVFEEVLRFIYTGKISLPSKVPLANDEELYDPRPRLKLVSGLLVASSKYQLDALALICEPILTREISIHSAGELLLLAHSNKRPQLMNEVIQFILHNYRHVFLTNSWTSTFKEAPAELIAELNREIFK